MDSYGDGDDMSLGIVPRESADHFDPSGSTIVVKREYYSRDDVDFVDVNGPFICIKKEKDDVDEPILLSNDVFEVKPLDPEMLGAEQQVGSSGELLVVWQERESSAEKSCGERPWIRKDPQCEVWSCKMSATYGHSTGPSRCTQHREAWMVLFAHCIVTGCSKFGVVMASESEPVRCEAHAAAIEDSGARPRQMSRSLDQLVGLDVAGPSELGLGLGLGDDCRTHDDPSAVTPEVDPLPLVGEVSVELLETRSADCDVGVALTSDNPAASLSTVPNGSSAGPNTSSVSVQAQITRLRQEHEGHRQRMIQIEIELARLEGSRNREGHASQETPVKKAPQHRPRQSAPSGDGRTSKVPSVVNDGKNNRNGSYPTGKVSLDGYNWRKYGEITLQGRTHPRVYYGCTNMGCIARKIEERTDEGSIRHFYEGVHNHPQPGKSFPRPVSIPHWKRRKRHHAVCME